MPSPPTPVPVPVLDPLFRNGHVATLSTVGVRPFLDEERMPAQDCLFETEPGVRVRVVSQAPLETPRGHIVLVHGLEGNSNGSYMRSLAQRALTTGFYAHRMNMRNCGGTEAYCPALYHAGLIADILAWLRHLRTTDPLPVFLVGFSLGGNQVSKLAGELGAEARHLLAGVCAVSTPIDLAVCSRYIQSPSNWLYQKQFVVRMKGTLRRKHALFPSLFSLNGIERIRTIWDIDDHYVAPLGGFRDAEHYYSTQSAQNFLGAVRLPMMMVHAADDPFIPISLYDQPAVRQNEWIQYVPVPHGGHMGFLARRKPKFWLNELVLNWMEHVLAHQGAESPHRAELPAVSI